MATTFVEYTGNGNNNKPFSFPSYKVADIKVEVDGVIKTSPTHYSISGYTTTGGGTVVFTAGNVPASPSAIRIFRDTDVDAAKATYTAGSSVKAADLNNNHTQLLYAAQEEQNQPIQTSGIKDGAITSAKILDGSIVNADINGSAAISGTKLADSSITKSKINDAILTGLANNLTSSATELNQLDGKTISSGTLSDSATTIPTSSAINSWVINLLNALGGFVAIANEVSFPNANPDPEDNAGTVVSIGDAGGVVVNGSGVSTTGRTLGGATVTITGFPSAMQSKTIAAGMGLIVQTTSTLNTYTYHKAIGTDSDIITISDQVSSFNQRYRFGSSDPTSDNDQGDLFFNTSTNLFKVYDDGAWIKTVPSDAELSNISIVAGELGWSDDLGSITESLTTASGGDINTVADNISSVTTTGGSISNVNTVAGAISNVNTVAGSISDVNRYANEYKIAASAPGSPSEGDLWYDSQNNLLKYHDGSASEAGSSDVIDEDDFSTNSATRPPSQQSVKAYVDALNWLDQSSKEDGSVIYWKNSSSKYFADNAQNIKTIEGGNF